MLLYAGKVFNNEIRDCRAYGVKVMSTPQGKICGNNIVPPDDVDADNVSNAEKHPRAHKPSQKIKQTLDISLIWRGPENTTRRQVWPFNSKRRDDANQSWSIILRTWRPYIIETGTSWAGEQHRLLSQSEFSASNTFFPITILASTNFRVETMEMTTIQERPVGNLQSHFHRRHRPLRVSPRMPRCRPRNLQVECWSARHSPLSWSLLSIWCTERRFYAS